MNQPDRVDGVQTKTLRRAEFPGRDQLVVAGIGIDDATASRRNPLEPALVERLQEHQDSARSRGALGFKKLLAAAELTGRDVILNARDDHRDDGPRLRDAGGFRHHARFHDLSLDLSEAGLQRALSGSLGYQDSGGPHQRIDDVADAKEELLDAPGYAGPDEGLVIVDLRLRQRGFRAGLLGRQKRRDPQLGGLF